MPPPKLFTSLPFSSNFMIGSSFEFAHDRASSQRSNAQTLLPSRSISRLTTAPHLRRSGSWAQPYVNLYELGASLGPYTRPPCECPRSPAIASTPTKATPNAKLMLRHMTVLPSICCRPDVGRRTQSSIKSTEQSTRLRGCAVWRPARPAGQHLRDHQRGHPPYALASASTEKKPSVQALIGVQPALCASRPNDSIVYL